MKKRLGRVFLNSKYIVDMNDKDMVQRAKDDLYEDICKAVQHDELYSWIEVKEDKNATEEDIPTFLLDEEE